MKNKKMVKGLQSAYRYWELRAWREILGFLLKELYGIKSQSCNLINFIFSYSESLHIQLNVMLTLFLSSSFSQGMDTNNMIFKMGIHIPYKWFSDELYQYNWYRNNWY